MKNQDKINELKQVNNILMESIIALRREGITNIAHELKKCKGACNGIIRGIAKEEKIRKDDKKGIYPKLGVKILDCGRVPMTVGKNIGNTLDTILTEMELQGLIVPFELVELKNWLRCKGNSYREQGDSSMWDLPNSSNLKVV